MICDVVKRGSAVFRFVKWLRGVRITWSSHMCGNCDHRASVYIIPHVQDITTVYQYCRS